MRLVLIEWEDSFGCSTSWAPLESSTPEVVICRSVGWLLNDNSAHKTIVPHITIETKEAESQGCGDMTIPTKAVLRIIDLSEGEG